jgi:hypothetical protein
MASARPKPSIGSGEEEEELSLEEEECGYGIITRGGEEDEENDAEFPLSRPTRLPNQQQDQQQDQRQDQQQDQQPYDDDDNHITIDDADVPPAAPCHNVDHCRLPADENNDAAYYDYGCYRNFCWYAILFGANHAAGLGAYYVFVRHCGDYRAMTIANYPSPPSATAMPRTCFSPIAVSTDIAITFFAKQ